MMIDRPAAAVAAAAIAPITLPRSVRQRIFLYLGILIVLLAFGAPFGGLMDIPISFFEPEAQEKPPYWRKVTHRKWLGVVFRCRSLSGR